LPAEQNRIAARRCYCNFRGSDVSTRLPIILLNKFAAPNYNSRINIEPLRALAVLN